MSRRIIATGIRSILPERGRRWLRRRLIGWPFGLGEIRRVSPASPLLAFEGKPVDRFYIEHFLAQYSADIRGHVLEIAESRYTVEFGGNRVTTSDILHVGADNPKATIVADLSKPDNIRANQFDCIILTQTLQMIYCVQRAVVTLRQILKPGGVVLATLPGIAPISRYDMERWGDYWRFTSLSASRLFETAFAPSEVEAKVYGNLASATAFLCGLAAEDLQVSELSRRDADYEVLIGIRAVKGGGV